MFNKRLLEMKIFLNVQILKNKTVCNMKHVFMNNRFIFRPNKNNYLRTKHITWRKWTTVTVSNSKKKGNSEILILWIKMCFFFFHRGYADKQMSSKILLIGVCAIFVFLYSRIRHSFVGSYPLIGTIKSPDDITYHQLWNISACKDWCWKTLQTFNVNNCMAYEDIKTRFIQIFLIYYCMKFNI